MKALLLGSIGVLAETSELQRRAYNTAFVAHGVDWNGTLPPIAGTLPPQAARTGCDSLAATRCPRLKSGAFTKQNRMPLQQALQAASLHARALSKP